MRNKGEYNMDLSVKQMDLDEINVNIEYAKQQRKNAVLAHDMVHYDWLLKELIAKKRKLLNQ